jgi:hypothetical protein
MYPDKITRNSKGIGYCAKAKLPKEGPDRGAIFFCSLSIDLCAVEF